MIGIFQNISILHNFTDICSKHWERVVDIINKKYNCGDAKIIVIVDKVKYDFERYPKVPFFFLWGGIIGKKELPGKHYLY